MKTEMKLEGRKSELVQLISNWAKKEMILQLDEVIEVDIRVVKNPQLVVLKINGQQDLDVARAMPVMSIKSWSGRAVSILNNAEITTIGQLAEKPYGLLIRYRNCGPATIREFAGRLVEMGIDTDWIEKGRQYRWRWDPTYTGR